MKRFEDLTIKQVKKEILAWEYDAIEPKSITVQDIYVEDDNEVYKQGDGSECERFSAIVFIGSERKRIWYEWNITNEEISSSWDNNDK